MAVAFSNAASNNTVANPSSVDPGAPAGAYIAAAVQTNSSGSSVDSLASGFVQLAFQYSVADAATAVAARKTSASGSEGTIAPIDMDGNEVVATMAFTGVDATTPEDVAVVVAHSDVGDTSPISASITPVTDGCMIYAWLFPDAISANNTTTTFSTTSGTTAAWTKPIDILGASSNRFQIAGGYALQTTAGAITVQAAVTGDSAGKTLVLVALRPAAGGGGGLIVPSLKVVQAINRASRY